MHGQPFLPDRADRRVPQIRERRGCAGPQGKKLKDVAAYIARGGGGDVDALAEDAALLGITIEGELDEQPQCLIWPENMPAVQVFLGLATQWNWVAISGFGGGQVFRTGLRLEGLPIVAGAYGIPVTPALLSDLRILEAEYIELTAR